MCAERVCVTQSMTRMIGVYMWRLGRACTDENSQWLILTVVYDSLDDVNKSCLAEFRKHWECLDNNNQQLWQCRRWERPLNKCVFDNLVSFPESLPREIRLDFVNGTRLANSPLQELKKEIPGAPKGEVPVHERKKQIYAHSAVLQ